MEDSVLVVEYCLTELGRSGCAVSQFCRDQAKSIDTQHLLFLTCFRLAMSSNTTTMYTITHQVLFHYLIIKMVTISISQS